MQDIYVFGHKNPDTDSVTASIAFSHLKNELGLNSKPMILGFINKETQFVLDYFNVPIPDFLEDVKLQIKDIEYKKNFYVNEYDSIKKVYDYMCEKNITGVPIVDKNKKLKGLLTSKMISEELINGNFTHLETSYDNILEVLNGEEILRFDSNINGNIIAASYRSTTFLNMPNLKPDTIMIVGDRHSLIEAAVKSKIKLLIIVGSLEIKEEHIFIAKMNKVNIIRTEYDTFHTSRLISFSSFCKNLLVNNRKISVKENDYYYDFKDKCKRLGFNNYPVINNKGICLGLIRITDIKSINKKQVILVDHNESHQSVEGLEEAEILEIIDHHKIGDLTTKMPINFRNMTVGSSNTIIYSMYLESGVNIPKRIAGLMLSGILSDTLKFTSPTTTNYDISCAYNLAKIADVNIDSYSNEMFKAGTNLSGKSIEEIVTGDLKIYDESNKKIAISQIITLNSEEIFERKNEYIRTINEIKNNRGYDLFILVVTDIIKNGSYIFINEDSINIFKDSLYENFYEGYFISEVLSRKKQVVPMVMDIIS